jgi:hypothetical protein
MANDLFSKYAPIFRHFTEAELRREIEQPAQLQINVETFRGKTIQIAYAPFDYVNGAAKVVIVGLTPGRQQMTNALVAAWRRLSAGAGEEEAKREAKVFASFSGPMRSNLVAMLDHIGVHHLCGLSSTATLWSADQHLAHFTSALRYPVFLDGENYSGNPSPALVPLLTGQLMQWLAAEMLALPDAIFVPLGPIATESVLLVAKHVGLQSRQVLSGLPHPSGANAERIAFFLGRKGRAALSNKVNPLAIETARDMLLRNVSVMRAALPA